MSDLTVRRLLIDLDTPIERHWNGGDAFRSAFFNALSMSFPVGEQFFIDSVRAGVRSMAPAAQARFAQELQGFVGQEATHRHLHARFNRHLASLGYANEWEPRIRRRLARLEGVDLRHGVAITAATEHFTALLAAHQHRCPGVLEGAQPRLQALWQWHAAEETEHRSTAFDVYRALGGNEHWRRRWFRFVSLFFSLDVLRQTASILRHDGMLWRWRTWASGARFLFGRDGLVRCSFAMWRAYLRPDFHPSQHDGRAAQAWLREHAQQFAVMGGGEAPSGPAAG